MGDHNGGAREVQQRFLQRTQGFDVEVVGRFVEQQHVAALFQGQRQVQTTALTTGQVLDELLLIAALEVEAAHVGARRDFIVADTDHVGTIGNRLEHRLAAVQVITALVYTGQLHGFANFDAARIRLLLAHQHAEQGRFTGTVTADHANDGAFGHGERQVVDQHTVAVTLGDVFELDDLVAQTRTGRDVDLVGLAALLEFLRLHFFKALQTRLGFGLTCLGALADPFQLVFHGLFMGCLLLGFLSQTVRFCFQPARIVAFIRNARAAVEFQNPARHVIQEVTVVRDRNHGAREVVQEVLQPGDGIGVQVVGRFVEQQHVGGGQQQTAQRDTALFTAGQYRNLRIPGRQTQRIGSDFELTLQVMTVAGLQDRLQLGLLGSQLVEISVRLGIFSVNLIKTRLGVLDDADRLFNHFTDRLVRVKLWLLRQITHVQFRHRARFAIKFGIDAGHDLQQRRLTRTVEAQHADLGAGEERKRDVFQDFTLRRHNFAQPMHGVDVRACFSRFVSFGHGLIRL